MKIYLAAPCEPALMEHFVNMGHDVELVSTSGIVAEPVSDHPDMFMCKMGAADSAPIIRCDAAADALGMEYPHDIPFNAACTGRYFVHNLKYTAPELLEAAKEMGMTLVNVKQGYAKCSTVVVDEDSIITYDMGIAAACSKAGMDVLTVEPGHVLLSGYNTGFIGGASGRVGDSVYFNGDLTAHPDHSRIIEFIESKGLNVISFPGWPLTDIGSIYSE